MIKTKTLLILGAGASMDYDFPSGFRLMEDILNFVSEKVKMFEMAYEQRLIFLALLLSYDDKDVERDKFGLNIQLIKDFARDLEYSGIRSIDEFLANKEQYKSLGKLCIAICISNYEGKVGTFNKVWNEEEKRYTLRHQWYAHLWQRICETEHDNILLSIDDLKQSIKNLVIVTFNYERSLEQYLVNAIQGHFGLSGSAALELVNQNLKIIHVYGDLGSLNDAPFGSLAKGLTERNADIFDEISKLQEWHNANDDSSPIWSYSQKTIQGWIAPFRAVEGSFRTFMEVANDNNRVLLDEDGIDRIFIFGFGFHDSNLSLFANFMRDCRYLDDSFPPISGTCKGLSLVEKRRLRSIFADEDMFSLEVIIDGVVPENVSKDKKRIEFFDMGILEFFRDALPLV